MENYILAIDTSCDETSASVCAGRRVLSNVISSQINIHQKYGGVYPALAKRAHQERIGFVIEEALRRASNAPYHPLKSSNSLKKNKGSLKDIKAVAVTYGPGLAIALEVGIRKAKEIVTGGKNVPHPHNPTPTHNSQPITHNIPLIAVNHMEGHLYSCLAQNSHGLPKRELGGPTLCLLVSGGHTELVLMKNHGQYQVLGQTLDDACGEALDKAAKILKLGYPGGPIIERLAEEHTRKPCTHDLTARLDSRLASRLFINLSRSNERGIWVRGKQMSLRGSGKAGDEAIPNDLKRLLRGKAPRNDSRLYVLSPPLKDKSNLNFSYSGLKTQFLYLVQSLSEKEFSQNIKNLAFSFQEACFEQLIRKTSQAITIYHPKTLLAGGGVIANKYLRALLRKLAKQNNLPIYFPPYKNLIGDNAAMIGVAASFKYQRGEFVENPEALDREPRLGL